MQHCNDFKTTQGRAAAKGQTFAAHFFAGPNTAERRVGADLRSPTLADAKGGFYFHPSDGDLSFQFPDRKKPLGGDGFGVQQLRNRHGIEDQYTFWEIFHRAAFGCAAASEHTSPEPDGRFKDAWAQVEARTRQER